MPISTLKIGLLSPAEMQQLAALTREVRNLTGKQFALLDPKLIAKLERSLATIDAPEQSRKLRHLAQRLQIEEPKAAADRAERAIKVERYRKYGVRVKYYDQSAA